MKRIIYTIVVSALLFCCSSDDSNDDQMDPQQTGHYSLRVNGDGFNDERYEFFRDTLEAGNLGMKFISSDNSSNSLFFALPTVEAGLQYSIAPYVNNTTSTSSIILQGGGVYLSESGSVSITEVQISETCYMVSGSFSIDYRRQDNAPGTFNVQASFSVPTHLCEDQ